MGSKLEPPEPLKSYAPGKVIFLGEHAVVYGQPALALPLDRGITVFGQDNADGPSLAPGLEPLEGAFLRLASRFSDPPVEVHLESQIPLSAGLGSSAALAVALVHLLAECSGERPTAAELAAHAESFEKEFHGNPSGVDHTTCALKVPIRFVRGDPPEVRRIKVRSLEWVVALSGPRKTTRENVMALRRRFEQSPREVEPIFSQIGALVESGVRALEGERIEELGRLMNMNQIALTTLGLSSEPIEALCTRMRSYGAWGAKLTGAGGGGAVIAVHPDPGGLVNTLRMDGIQAFVSSWEGA